MQKSKQAEGQQVTGLMGVRDDVLRHMSAFADNRGKRKVRVAAAPVYYAVEGPKGGVEATYPISICLSTEYQDRRLCSAVAGGADRIAKNIISNVARACPH